MLGIFSEQKITHFFFVNKKTNYTHDVWWVPWCVVLSRATVANCQALNARTTHENGKILRTLTRQVSIYKKLVPPIYRLTHIKSRVIKLKIRHSKHFFPLFRERHFQNLLPNVELTGSFYRFSLSFWLSSVVRKRLFFVRTKCVEWNGTRFQADRITQWQQQQPLQQQ